MKKEIAGQPVWLWATGAAVVIAGYLYFSHRAKTASSSGQGQGQGTGAGKSTSSSSFKEWLVQHQGGPAKPPKPPHHKPKPPVDPGGPRRRPHHG